MIFGYYGKKIDVDHINLLPCRSVVIRKVKMITTSQNNPSWGPGSSILGPDIEHKNKNLDDFQAKMGID